MAIVAYTGLPRSGKSYTAVEQVILPALRQGRLVYTNLPLKLDAIQRDIKSAQVTPVSVEELLARPEAILEIPAGAVIVLDEIWRLWPAGKKVDRIPEPFKSFLAEHGHRVDAAGNAQTIVLVTQDLAQIAAFARQLVEQTFRTVKLTTIGFQRKFRTDVYQGSVAGPNPPQSAQLRQIFGRYRPQIYQYYVSHTMSEAAEGSVNESGVDRRGNVLLRPLVLLSPLAVVALVWFGVHELHASKLAKERPAQSPGARGADGDAPGRSFLSSLAGSSRSLPARDEPPTWRVSGWLDGSPPLGGYAWLTDGKVTVWVRLSECRRSLTSISCPHGGVFWSSQGEQEGGVNAPVGPWSAGPGPAPARPSTGKPRPVHSVPRTASVAALAGP